MLLRILKKKLTDKKGTWVEELFRVLWSYRTMVRMSIGETPFVLTYGSEVLVPIEVGMQTDRV